MIAAGSSDFMSQNNETSYPSIMNQKSGVEIPLASIKFNQHNISKAMQKRLEATQCSIFVEGETPENHLLTRYKELNKEVKINLKEELNYHYDIMSNLIEFKDIQFSYDHSFIKNIIGTLIEKERHKNAEGSDPVIMLQDPTKSKIDPDKIALHTSGLSSLVTGEGDLSDIASK